MDFLYDLLVFNRMTTIYMVVTGASFLIFFSLFKHHRFKGRSFSMSFLMAGAGVSVFLGLLFFIAWNDLNPSVHARGLKRILVPFLTSVFSFLFFAILSLLSYFLRNGLKKKDLQSQDEKVKEVIRGIHRHDVTLSLSEHWKVYSRELDDFFTSK